MDLLDHVSTTLPFARGGSSSPSPPSTALARPIELAHAAADRYRRAAQADNTARARASDWRVFQGWCDKVGAPCLPAPPATVAAFIAHAIDVEGKAVATIARYLSTIATAHRRSGVPDPTRVGEVEAVLDGIRRTHGVAKRGKRAILPAQVAAFLRTFSQGLGDVRDRALILAGMTTGMRRSELCSLDVGDLTHNADAIVAHLRWSKTDQHGEGRHVAIPRLGGDLCPAGALEAWIRAAGISEGAVFRRLYRGGRVGERISDAYVAVLVHRAAQALGLPSSQYGGHSLRAGYITHARQHELDWDEIMEQTGHKKIDTVRGYVRRAPEVATASRVREIFGDLAK